MHIIAELLYIELKTNALFLLASYTVGIVFTGNSSSVAFQFSQTTTFVLILGRK